MIRFDGELTGNTKEYFIKKTINRIGVFGFLMLLLNIPFWHFFYSGTNTAKYVVPVVLIVSAFAMYIFKLIVSKREKTKERENIKKVIIKDDVITIISEESSTKKILKVLKKSVITENFMNWCFLQLTFYLFAYVRKVYFLKVASKNLKSFLLINL